jgi:hypothetical protein
MPSRRRFPPPWTVEDHLARFIVKDRTGQALAHIYYEDTGQPAAAKLLIVWIVSESERRGPFGRNK